MPATPDVSSAPTDQSLRWSEVVRWLTSLTLVAMLLSYAYRLYLHMRPGGDHSRGIPMMVMTGVGLICLWFLARRKPANPRWSWNQFMAMTMATGLVLLLGWAIAFPAVPVSDFLFFHESAQWFIQYGAFADADGNLLCFRQPGFTVFIAGIYALFGPNTWAVVGANALLFIALIAMTGFAGKAFCNEKCGRIGAMLVAVMPAYLAAGTLIATEMVTTLGLVVTATLATFALKDRPRWAMLAGVGLLLGITTYLRPNAPPLLGSIMIVTFIKRRSWPEILGSTFLTFACMFVLLYPWALRNEKHFGLRTFSTQVGTNLYISYHKETERFDLAKEFLKKYPDVRDSYPIGIASAKTFIREHPFLAAKRVIRNFITLTCRNDEMVYWSTEISPKVPRPRWVGRWLEGISNGLYFVCVVAALIGVWKYRLFDRFPNLAVFGATFVLFHWASSLLQTQPRYHLIVLPFLILCAAPWLAGWRGAEDWGKTESQTPPSS